MIVTAEIGSRVIVPFEKRIEHFLCKWGYLRGKSIGSYINESKVLRAKSLLAASDMDIGETAHAWGFADIYSFSRFFSNSTGESPQKFRKICNIV